MPVIAQRSTGTNSEGGEEMKSKQELSTLDLGTSCTLPSISKGSGRRAADHRRGQGDTRQGHRRQGIPRCVLESLERRGGTRQRADRKGDRRTVEQARVLLRLVRLRDAGGHRAGGQGGQPHAPRLGHGTCTVHERRLGHQRHQHQDRAHVLDPHGEAGEEEGHLAQPGVPRRDLRRDDGDRHRVLQALLRSLSPRVPARCAAVLLSVRVEPQVSGVRGRLREGARRGHLPRGPRHGGLFHR